MLTHDVPVAVRQVLDVPPERLAAVIGGWPEPALLESGPDFGDAGQFSILTAYPRLVWEATGDELVFAHGQRPVRARPREMCFPIWRRSSSVTGLRSRKTEATPGCRHFKGA